MASCTTKGESTGTALAEFLPVRWLMDGRRSPLGHLPRSALPTSGGPSVGRCSIRYVTGDAVTLSRRDFLNRFALGAGVLLVGSSEVLLTAPNAAAAPAPPASGYGPLVPDPAGRLALPEGFGYTILSEAGVTRLESGEFSPDNGDGTGAFRGRAGGSVLVQNHELRDPFGEAHLPVPHLDGLTYDPGAAGGCVVIEANRDGRRIREHVSLAGTSTNCAGGITPWGTWLSCEETEDLAGQRGATKDHGYVFEIDPFDPRANRDPQPIKALGRYAHEAVAVDPRTGDMYLTEDAARPNGLLYRWEAPAGFQRRRGVLRALGATEGVLAAMSCTDGSGAHVDDLSRATEVGRTYAVRWVSVPERDARTSSTRAQFADSDITRARKLEGSWWGDGGVYVVTSFAREESPVPHDGQVWFYDPRRRTLTLTLRFGVNPNPDAGGGFDGPDNITVSPWGGMILAEDGDGVQHLIGVTEGGTAFPMARNEVNQNEFAGPVYSHDHRILFVNLYQPGITYAITGPWRPQR
jgi:secreted PhoX family phosphatase